MTPRTSQTVPAGAWRRGFTFIELLIVTAVLAILAVIASGRIGDSKRRAYLATMQADLRNLAAHAEREHVSANSYVEVEPPLGSAGVTLTFEGQVASWRATATHRALPGVTCTMAAAGGEATAPVCN